MSLVELIADADERGLTVSGLACLDRCVSLLGGDDEILRPLWASLADDSDAEEWATRLEQARVKLDTGDGPDAQHADAAGAAPVVPAAAAASASAEGEAALLARWMLAAAPAVRSAAGVREWADACSVAALRVHQLLDASAAADPSSVESYRAGGTEGMSPLVAAELRRQITVLELLAGHGSGGLRQALAVSTEGRRVLRAVVSRRARGRA
ncbi:hypothetical protein ACOT81_30130 [Streptomyces sp. WI04-05B]|uniref:hypothetical protein n=1 Tax=Streptomyces TaxID=1883 RepID=UPI0029BCBCFA|nr:MULTISPECIES: hypothetical protein [unclassified Streptomyces]MDX2544008.1 hypothetical protein [Streptomyces sp. WI04-05B]MDX2584282.1 hypothetical protein [Streptomyces sp. WI04-05A]